ncbi:ash family protein [Salmonella enterica]|nr:host cell division inhibitor Icd-like protein [Salmonella enterica]ECD0156100.1 host cell division inhibitor Icd-like protein [Salmonella enterica subsp. enterica]ECD4438643.1 host cell division inhibitor Icd-like protein [Salmonella enterica subsp. enterica serovar Florida]ECT3490071.1 host cell division inhibitor Icd-like protein [Salmonella enterica subsp. enterica serovar Braenderup]EEG1557523.1 ash family protein [Salmonella enterica subsp. enterica serovar Midway]
MLYLPEQHNCIRFLLALKAFDNRRKNIHYGLLTSRNVLSYRLSVAPQWATGRCNPYQYKATPDADCVFFIVVKSVPPSSAEQIRTVSMVALAGQLSGWPVSLYAGIATPVSVTTNHERCNSGGDSLIKYEEIIIMMTTPTPLYPQFIWLFLAVRRSDTSAHPHREEVTAPTYQAARRVIAREFIASFAGRLPVREVPHV